MELPKIEWVFVCLFYIVREKRGVWWNLVIWILSIFTKRTKKATIFLVQRSGSFLSVYGPLLFKKKHKLWVHQICTNKNWQLPYCFLSYVDEHIDIKQNISSIGHGPPKNTIKTKPWARSFLGPKKLQKCQKKGVIIGIYRVKMEWKT